jgi:hypothetical protein
MYVASSSTDNYYEVRTSMANDRGLLQLQSTVKLGKITSSQDNRAETQIVQLLPTTLLCVVGWENDEVTCQ